MKRKIILFASFLIAAVIVIMGSCKKDEEQDNPEEHAINNTAWAETDESTFEIIGIHENGSMMAVNTNGIQTVVNSVVFKSSTDSPGFYVWLDENNHPSKAYVNGNIVLFDNYTGSTVDVAIVRESGNYEILRNIDYDEPGYKQGIFLKELSSTQSWGDVLRWAGHGLSLAACVVEVAGAISTGGALAPVAVIGCGAAITGIALEFVAEDNEAIQASSAAIGAFAGAAGCMTSGLSCVSFFANSAGAVVTAAQNTNAALQDEIETAENELAQSTGQPEFKITPVKYGETEDLEQLVVDEFGPDYRMADWGDIKALEGIVDLASWADEVGIAGDASSLYVTNNGQHFYDNYRHYFIARHEHSVPGGFLVHDHVDNHYFDLGSWYDIEMKILCKKNR